MPTRFGVGTRKPLVPTIYLRDISRTERKKCAPNEHRVKESEHRETERKRTRGRRRKRKRKEGKEERERQSEERETEWEKRAEERGRSNNATGDTAEKRLLHNFTSGQQYSSATILSADGRERKDCQ